MKMVALAVATLVLQRALGWPGMPQAASLVMLPMVLIVAGALLHHGYRWTQLAILLGLGWDLLLEPVVGPGGIAWSVAALGLCGLAGVVADRSAKAWIAFGAVGTLLVIVVRMLMLLPLGLHAATVWSAWLVNVLTTAMWCGLVGWLRAQDLAARWTAYRTRKLR